MKSLLSHHSHPRVRRVLNLFVPLVIIASIFVLVYYAAAMRFTLFHRIIFSGPATYLNREDKQAIRALLMRSDLVQNPPHTLVRYTITLDSLRYTTNSQRSAWYSGRVAPNSPYMTDGVVAVSKQSGAWAIVFLATGT